MQVQSLKSNNAKDFFFRKDGLILNSGSGINAFYLKNKNNSGQILIKEFDTLHTPISQYEFKGYERFLIATQRSKALWYQQATKTLWTGFVDGLVYYQNGNSHSLTDETTGLPIIASNFQEGDDNTLYVGTVEQGIYVVKNKKIIKHYSKTNSLISNKIIKIKLADNVLWIVCTGAVQSIDLKSGYIKTINTTDGLGSSEIFDIEIIKDRIYVATANGLQFFSSEIKTKNFVKPVCFINKIEADEQSYFSGEEIILKYDIKNISVNLQGIALKSDGGLTYQYRLQPGAKNWITVSADQNLIRFTSLAPGNYIFEAKAINEDGFESEGITGFKFTIAKPWWLQWWFLALCFLIAATLIFIIYKTRLQVQQKKMKVTMESFRAKEELRHSQLAALKSQMNPHFMFNALNSIQEFILTNDKRQANMYMGKFADLMRMTLDMSNKSLVRLFDEIKILKLYLELEALRFEEHFSTSIKVAENINTADIQLPAMLIQPYVENAVKHGLLHLQAEKKLSVSFTLEEPSVISCTITDNGIGRKRSGEINELRYNKHTSFATGATQKRLELLNVERPLSIAVQIVDLMDTSGQAIGTSVTIKIPF